MDIQVRAEAQTVFICFFINALKGVAIQSYGIILISDISTLLLQENIKSI